MKALSMRIFAGMITLGALLYFLACSPATQNNNSSQNQALSPNQNEANGRTKSEDLEPCHDYGSDPGGTHAKGIKDKIKAKMGNSLKKLLKDEQNPNGTFTLEVEKGTGTNVKYFVAYVTGKVSGDDNLKELSNILNDYQDEKECLRIVYFLPEAGPSPSSVVRGPGFEWGACEYPLHVCPNGECCDTKTTDTNANANVNTNSNSNSNSNTNSNSNVRRGNP